MSANKQQVAEIRKNQVTGSEVGDALMQEIQMLKGSLMEMKHQMGFAGRVAAVVVVSSNTGETGTERTYDIPLVKAKHSALAISCHSGASPASVVGATCRQGQVKVKFDIDPSTDHKVSIWVACPDKRS